MFNGGCLNVSLLVQVDLYLFDFLGIYWFADSFLQLPPPGQADVIAQMLPNCPRYHTGTILATGDHVGESVPPYMQREALFKSFANQVIVTRDIDRARRIVLIIHDPQALLSPPYVPEDV
ncbi:hypothetical protein CONLIGDRAFT_686792 [Coniochaeta ligniaria NRRL 30616]|uniref:Arb2-like domain-containing protein n=1 Tax=Coniochaeta ligniaria NRRL 30616 TaxID=1408157 RepID=A0A1J7J2G6_9PEZI|nr:hypothetical protein CONLIGDRAFT_686792 [Coniochaeta ligniaria NRRL 30616]